MELVYKKESSENENNVDNYENPYKDINFVSRKAKIVNVKTGQVVFEQDVVFPDFFDDASVSIVSEKYLCNEAKRKETSLKEMIDRVSNTIGDWGMKDGYFQSDEEYKQFVYKLKYYQANQYFAFNSPVYFNVGLMDKPQCSACFILKIEDNMESIFEISKVESMIFKWGSGSGLNMSPLRSSKEKVRGSGSASGPISFLKSHDVVAGVVKSGGTLRRSAKLAALNVDHPDIMEFISCKKNEEIKLNILKNSNFEPKNGEEYSDHVFFQNTNISVRIFDSFMKAVEKDEDWYTKYVVTKEKCEKFKAKDILWKISELAWDIADPGLQFHDTVNKWNSCLKSGEINASNPCVVGDTLVAVADGRNVVSFKQLAEENKDVPVYCANDNKLEIRIMRNPRITGEKQPIYKVTLDDGSIYRVTGNHEFILRNGNKIQASNLKYGDSLKVLSKFDRGYIDLNFMGKRIFEHRKMVEFNHDVTLDENFVAHHKDENIRNNYPENLEIMLKKDHDILHRVKMLGNNNPMNRAKTEWIPEKWNNYKNNMSKAVSGENNGRYLDITNEQIKEECLKLAKKLGRMFTKEEWYIHCQENNMPNFKAMSKWRINELGGNIEFLSKWTAHVLGYDVINENQNVLTQYFNALENGYKAIITDDEYKKICIFKNCEKCGKEFTVNYSRREVSYCKSCSIKLKLTGKIMASDIKLKIGLASKIFSNTEQGKEYKKIAGFVSNKNKALKCGSMLMFLGKEFDNDNWNNYRETLKETDIKKFIQSDIINKYWDNDWNSFKQECAQYNHKVVSVELDGIEDVYNGTVDEFHNYFIGGHYKGAQQSFVLTSNCGEFLAQENTSCNLASYNILKLFKKDKLDYFYFDIDTFKDLIKTIVTAQEIIVDRSSYPTNKVIKNATDYRPIGLGYSNLGATLMYLGLPYDSVEGRNLSSCITALTTGLAYITVLK